MFHAAKVTHHSQLPNCFLFFYLLLEKLNEQIRSQYETTKRPYLGNKEEYNKKKLHLGKKR
jgi:hypothetical protein